MHSKHWSMLAVSKFNSRKLLVIISIVVTTLTVDSQIGNIADFIAEELASDVGITTFIGICAIFAVTQYYILAYVKHGKSEERVRAGHLNLLHNIVTMFYKPVTRYEFRKSDSKNDFNSDN